MKPSSPRRDALVLYSHLPGEGVPNFNTAPVAPICCWQRFDYWRGVNRHWDDQRRTLILLEHDIEASDEHLQALLACPHPACTWAYELHMPSGCPEGAPAQRGVHDSFADFSGLGLVKLAPRARAGPLRRECWQRLELAVNAAASRPWHLHTDLPLAHHNW